MKIVFVKRPAWKQRSERGALVEALRATAKNGKAVRLRRSVTTAYSRLAREHLVVHAMRQGKFILAWAKKKGAR